MAGKKGVSDRLAKLGALASRLPFAKKLASRESPSPGEDEALLGDLVAAKGGSARGGNARGDSATGPRSSKAASRDERTRIDFRAIIVSARKSPPFLIGAGILVLLVLAIGLTSIVVSAPPRKPAVAPPFTEEGRALVKTWLPPPGDPLEPRMAFQRESSPTDGPPVGGPPKYTAEDAARIGLNLDPQILAGLSADNDEVIENLYGTVP